MSPLRSRGSGGFSSSKCTPRLLVGVRLVGETTWSPLAETANFTAGRVVLSPFTFTLAKETLTNSPSSASSRLAELLGAGNGPMSSKPPRDCLLSSRGNGIHRSSIAGVS
eukprot:Skav219346  [mRNA]  locus=scaffold76:327474:333746:- [translate_table: standard]